MPEMKKRYTHETKGGEYELVGVSSGAGGRKGDVVMVYQSAVNGQLFHREPEDFSKRMKPLEPSTNAQLLAALSDALEWIDAVPQDTALPAMPGFDRDAVNQLIAAAKGEV